MSENPAPSKSRSLSLLAAALILLALVGTFLIGMRINADTDPSVTGVVTQGTGSVTAKPDQLEFEVTVRNKATKTGDAMARTTNGIKAVIAALTKAGVAEKDIATTNISIEPSYNYSRNKETIDGYVSSSSLKVLVRKLDDAGGVITAATVAAGDSGSVQNVSMRIGERDDLVAQARQQAVENSKQAAQALATAAGRDVDELVYVEEVSTAGAPTPEPMYASGLAADTASRADVPIAAGEQKVDVTVKVRWSLS
ncbi:MAG: SIMPL domain-containing protein [Propionibacteriales bacterium]|nr:SIMPL domain-containing protein [Propionibacteriales bacterium]